MSKGKMSWKVLFLLSTLLGLSIASAGEEDDGVKFASKCEVCKIVSFELEEKLKETGKSHQVIESCYSLDDCKKKTKYKVSQARLEDTLDGLCERMLQYNVHKERTDSTRFAKGISQTFETLHGLVAKGVKVELGIPYELWNNTSAEISNLKSQCESLLEDHEDDITEWFHKYQETKDVRTYLCTERVLSEKDVSCLKEPMGIPPANPSQKKPKEASKKKKKGKKANNEL